MIRAIRVITLRGCVLMCVSHAHVCVHVDVCVEQEMPVQSMITVPSAGDTLALDRDSMTVRESE